MVNLIIQNAEDGSIFQRIENLTLKEILLQVMIRFLNGDQSVRYLYGQVQCSFMSKESLI